MGSVTYDIGVIVDESLGNIHHHLGNARVEMSKCLGNSTQMCKSKGEADLKAHLEKSYPVTVYHQNLANIRLLRLRTAATVGCDRTTVLPRCFPAVLEFGILVPMLRWDPDLLLVPALAPRQRVAQPQLQIKRRETTPIFAKPAVTPDFHNDKQEL
ncbi:hypothetical protein DL769_002668 [Monosporascus sp. CRB-8-3]|nr:hypothetical protein DL769_002668 [Monosporascus sp. CRB-8-3]